MPLVVLAPKSTSQVIRFDRIEALHRNIAYLGKPLLLLAKTDEKQTDLIFDVYIELLDGGRSVLSVLEPAVRTNEIPSFATGGSDYTVSVTIGEDGDASASRCRDHSRLFPRYTLGSRTRKRRRAQPTT